MPTAVVVLPILPDKEEALRRFVQDLTGYRRGEYEGFARRLGVGGVRVYLARARSWREVIVACVETGNAEEAFRRLADSEEPFDEWFKERLAELHGYEPGQQTGAPPELIFEHPVSPEIREGRQGTMKRKDGTVEVGNGTAEVRWVRQRDEASIREKVSELQTAQQRESVDDFVSLFTPEAVWVTAHGKRLTGRDEIHEFTKKVLPGAMRDSTVRYEVAHVSFVRDDVAVVYVRQQPITHDG